MISKQFKTALIGIVLLTILGAGGLVAWEKTTARRNGSLLQAMRAKEPERTPAPSANNKPSDLVKKRVTISIPRLDRPLTVTASISEKNANDAKKKIEELTVALKKDPGFYSNWLELGIYRKFIGDYVSAREAWEYAVSIAPEAVPLSNLADLYIYKLGDLKKGEEFLLKAIEKAPQTLSYYETAYEFYVFIVKEPGKARAVLEQGKKANPTNAIPFEHLLSKLP